MNSRYTGGMIRPYDSKIAAMNRLLDGFIIAGSLEIISILYAVDNVQYYHLAALLGTVFFLFLAELKSIYHSWRLSSFETMNRNVFAVWLTVVIVLISLAFMTNTVSEFRRGVVFGWFIWTPSLLIIQRSAILMFLRSLRRRGWNTRTVAIAGSGDSAIKLSKNIADAGWMGLRLVGMYDDRKVLRKPLSEGGTIRFAGNLNDMVQAAKAGKIDYVYIGLPMVAEKRIIEIVNELADTTASVFLIPDFFVFDLMNAHWSSVGGVPIVSIHESPFYGVDGWFKRIEDVLIGSLILVLIAIPMLVIALGVKLSSPGPVLFKQRRYGLNGKVVDIWKFRSMSVCEDGPDVHQAQKNDPRVTPFGAFIRRTSLDELPQFFNVLQGHMSIVGPRPHAIAHNELYRSLIHGYMLRHKVKPGITGWAQINGLRGETDTTDKMKARVEYDLHYIQNWSLWLDLRIIFLTIFKGFVSKQAY